MKVKRELYKCIIQHVLIPSIGIYNYMHADISFKFCKLFWLKLAFLKCYFDHYKIERHNINISS